MEKESIDVAKTIEYWLNSSIYDLETGTTLLRQEDLHMDKKEIRDIVARFHAAVSGRGIRIDKVILYGSTAVGRQTEDSDLDLAVVSRDFGHDRFTEGKMLTQIAWRIDSRIHPVPIPAASYLNDTWIPLIHEIRAHGVEV